MCHLCDVPEPWPCEDCGYAADDWSADDEVVLCEECADERENQDNAGAIG